MDRMFGVVTTETDEEFTVVAHIRGWCHLGSVCAICKAEGRAFEAERRFESVVSG